MASESAIDKGVNIASNALVLGGLAVGGYVIYRIWKAGGLFGENGLFTDWLEVTKSGSDASNPIVQAGVDFGNEVLTAMPFVGPSTQATLAEYNTITTSGIFPQTWGVKAKNSITVDVGSGIRYFTREELSTSTAGRNLIEAHDIVQNGGFATAEDGRTAIKRLQQRRAEFAAWYKSYSDTVDQINFDSNGNFVW